MIERENLISVIMGVHNGVSGLRNAIASITEQTYQNWEFIICDDGSSDGSLRCLREYKDDRRFIIIQNNENMGLAATLNHCIEYCGGEFIARMDADDLSYPDRFERQLKELHEHPEISFISSSADIFNGAKITGRRILKRYPTKYDLIWNSAFIHPATMFRARDLRAVGGYRVAKETVRGQDYDLFMRMYGAGYRGANLQEPVFRYTVDERNIRRRTFKARVGEAKIRKAGYKAMGIWPWAAPMTLKPFAAFVLTAIRAGLGRRKQS